MIVLLPFEFMRAIWNYFAIDMLSLKGSFEIYSIVAQKMQTNFLSILCMKI